MQINLDVTIHNLGCASISLDAMDVSGDNHLDVVTNIFKRRLDADGLPKEVVRPWRALAAGVGFGRYAMGVSPSQAPSASPSVAPSSIPSAAPSLPLLSAGWSISGAHKRTEFVTPLWPPSMGDDAVQPRIGIL